MHAIIHVNVGRCRPRSRSGRRQSAWPAADNGLSARTNLSAGQASPERGTHLFTHAQQPLSWRCALEFPLVVGVIS
jgi:hypothetical protein